MTNKLPEGYSRVGDQHIFSGGGTSVRGLLTDIREYFVDIFGGRLKSIENSMVKSKKRGIESIKKDMIEVFGFEPDNVQFSFTQAGLVGGSKVLVTAVVSEKDVEAGRKLKVVDKKKSILEEAV